MNRLMLIVIFLVAMPVANLSAQGDAVATPSSIPVHNLTIRGKTATKILDDLAKKYHIVIGVYGSGTFGFVNMPPPIDVEVKDGTLANVFDAIAGADQQLEWHQGSNGAVHFVIRGASLPLMDVTVHSFEYENPQWPQITDRLRNIPEIYGWLQVHKCSMPDQTIRLVGRPPRPWRRFSVHASDLPVSSILDQVAAESRTYYWHAAQVTTEPCVVTIQWWL